MKKTKFLVGILSLFFVFGFISCGDVEEQYPSETTNEHTDENSNDDSNTTNSSDNTNSSSNTSSSSAKVGYIILANGTTVSPGAFAEIDATNPPVAIVAFVNSDGKTVGVGLHASEKMALAVSESDYFTSAANQNLAETTCANLICTAGGSYETTYQAAGNATFSGDSDGSDNWSIIKANVNDSDNEELYPGFYWANNYGTTYQDYLGGITSDWYIPSLPELCYIYRNLASIKMALTQITNCNVNDGNGNYTYEASKYSDSTFDSYYFSSSVNNNCGTNILDYSYMWCVNFSDAYMIEATTWATTKSILVVRKF